MAGGQVITSGQGSVTYSTTATSAATGSESTTAAGDVAKNRLHPLRSKKTVSGSATFALSGQQVVPAIGSLAFSEGYALGGQAITSASGSLAKQLTKAVTGSSVTVAQGSVAPPSVPASGNWTARATGSDVVWAHNFASDTEVTAFTTNPSAGSGHAGNALKPYRVTDPIVGNAMRFLALGGKLTQAYTAGGTSMVIDDVTLWPNPAVSGSYYVLACDPDGGQDDNLFLVTAISGNTLTVQYVPSSGQPVTTTQRSFAIGTHIGHQGGANWVRNFSALTGDSNGIGTDDVNNAGVTLRTKNNQTTYPHGAQAFGYGWYGRSEYHSEFATWRPSDYGGNGIDSILRSNLWDGTEFYIQWRMKVDPRYFIYAAPIDRTSEDGRFGRKIWMLQAEMTVPQQLTGGYHPSNRYWVPFSPEPPVTMAAFDPNGGLAGRRITADLAGNGSYQPGSAWASTALGQSFQPIGSAYETPANEWVTFLLRVKPGLRWDYDTNPTGTGVRNTEIELKMARENATAYTTVISVTDQAIIYGSSGPAPEAWTSALPGYSAIAFTGYLNVDLGNVPPMAAYYVDIAEVVFSHATIPLPTWTLPTWVPNAGEISTLTVGNGYLTNKFRDVVASYYSDFYSAKIVNDYSGRVVNPYFGTYGGIVAEGGGHSGTNDNSVMVLELGSTSATWKRMTNPTALYGTGTDETTKGNNSVGSFSRDDLWGEYSVDAQPMSRHSYAAQDVLGPEHGGAAYGSLYRVIANSAGDDGYNVGEAPHKVDFDSTSSGTVWERAGTRRNSGNSVSLSVSGAPCWTVHVPEQRRIYIETGGGTHAVRWFDLATGLYVNGTGTQRTLDGDTTDGGMMIYIPERALMLFCHRVGGNLRFKTMDLSVSDPSWVNTNRATSTNIPISASWSHIAWCPDNSKLIVGNVSGDANCVHEVTIPTNVASTWTNERVGFQVGQTIAWSGSNCYKAWSYNRKTRSIVYVAAVSPDSNNPSLDSVYVYRPRNT
jgi:hypothetical protein